MSRSRGVSPFWNTPVYWHIWLHSKNFAMAGPWSEVSCKKRAKIVCWRHLLCFHLYLLLYVPFVVLQNEDKDTNLKWMRKFFHFLKLPIYKSVFFLVLVLKFLGNNWTCMACCLHWAFEMKTQRDPAQLVEQFGHRMC